MFEKLKAKGLLKPFDPRPDLNPLPARFDVNKRCAYHQGSGHDTDRCFNLCHAIQDLIGTQLIAPITRPNINNNPLLNHNFGRGPRINCLFSKGEEEEKDPSNLIYDILECFMLTWEELMGISSTIGYDIWNRDNSEIPNYSTHTYGGIHFKPHSDDSITTYGGRHFKPHSNNPTPTYVGRHFKPQDSEQSDLSKIAHITIEGIHFKPPHLEIDNPVEALNKVDQQTPNEQDEVLKQLQKTQASISLWGLLMASYKHCQNLVDLLNQI